MVLSFSRKIFLRFYLNQKMANFLHGHEIAFRAFEGVPRVLLYDNLKSAVLERFGSAIRFHPTILEFAAHYRFEPRPVAIARGNEKGRVERAIRYVRDNFFAARKWKDLDDLNYQAELWCENQASDRTCPEDRSITVRQAFEQEKSSLTECSIDPFPTHERVEVKVGKTPYVRFDLNDYSIPHVHVRRILTVMADVKKVIILDGTHIIAEHFRSYDKGQQIENDEHIKALVEVKKQARHNSGQNRLTHACPSSKSLLQLAVEQHYSLRNITDGLLKLLDCYGATALELAIKEALVRKTPHPTSVRWNLERQREQNNKFPLVNLDLPNDKRVKELVVIPHDLNSYNQLQFVKEEE